MAYLWLYKVQRRFEEPKIAQNNFLKTTSMLKPKKVGST